MLPVSVYTMFVNNASFKSEHFGLRICISFVTNLFRVNRKSRYTNFKIRQLISLLQKEKVNPK